MVGSPKWDTLLRDYGPEHFDDRSNRTLPQQRTPPPRSALNRTLTQLNDSWSPPDPGFHQDEYTESDLDEGTLEIMTEVMGTHISDFYATYGEEISEPVRNPYIDDEAEESEVISIDPVGEEEQPSRKRRRHVIILSSDDDSQSNFSWTFLTTYFIQFLSSIHDFVIIHICSVS